MRLLGVTLVAAAVVGCGGNDESPAAGAATKLTIAYWPAGRDAGASPQRWTLRCGPLGGTHPNRRAACARLAKLERPFRPVPKDMACTQIFGGPDEALVKGVHRGQRIWVRFNLRNGCEIARWQRHVPLLPPAGGAAS